MNSQFKVILFDIDNTLLDFNECAKQSILYACKTTGLKYQPRFINAFHTVNDFLWHQVEDGVLTVKRLHEIRFPTIFSALDVVADGTEFERLFRENMRVAAAPVDGALDVLSYLKNGYYLAVASNSSYEQQKNRLDTAGMSNFFKNFFVSEKLGASKPDKAFFERILVELPTKNKNEILFVGDSLSADMKGGVDFGIKTCWFNKNGEKTDLPVDFIISSLKELKNIL
ncbi:MAG: YjjG family noncanonical pyrimidine nucleotidase [Clostridia bacterium]|nr:YjjG family noncanonical pyrimidine nucleotidase [Clostridia bacterium]